LWQKVVSVKEKQMTLASQTYQLNGNWIFTLLLIVVVGLLIWGLTDPKKHPLVLALAVLLLLAFIFAILFGAIALTLTI